MEVAGIVVGVAGLAGAFSTCLECFELVQKGRSLGRDYTLLMTRVGNLRLRFRSWGMACGLTGTTAHDARLEEPQLKEQLLLTMKCMILLFLDCDKMARRYKVRGKQPIVNPAPEQGMVLPYVLASDAVTQGSFDFLLRISQAQKQATFLTTIRWAIEDRKHLVEMVSHLDGFLSDLESLTSDFRIRQQQKHFIDVEVESISDVHMLQDMAAASIGEDDAVSSSARLRLQSMRGNATSQPAQDASATINASSIDETFFTADSSAGRQRTDHDNDDGKSQPLSADEEVLCSNIQQLVEQSFESELLISQRQALVNHLVQAGLEADYAKQVIEQPDILRYFRERHNVASLMHKNKPQQRHMLTVSDNVHRKPIIQPFDQSCAATIGHGILPVKDIIDRTSSQSWCIAPPGNIRAGMLIRELRAVTDERAQAVTLVQGDPTHLLAFFEGPLMTPFEKGIFVVEIHLGPDYPFRAPTCYMLTKVYHPNIDYQGQICLDILKAGWSPVIRLRILIESIRSLLADPCADDPIVPEIASTCISNPEQFDANARLYTQKYATLEIALQLFGRLAPVRASGASVADGSERRRSLASAHTNSSSTWWAGDIEEQ